MVQEAVTKDSEMKAVRSVLLNDNWTNKVSPYRAVASELSVIDNVILRENRLVISVALRKQILAIAHSTHQGVVRTKSLLRTKV